jgi:RNA polymerase sigma-70 factor (ECF subfamily)
MSQAHSFDDLMARLRTGDNEAAAQVFHRFGERLIAVAQKRLGPQMRPKVDPEDVLQSVFRSFFCRQAAGKLDDLETWDSLWGMLVVITLRKCGRRLDYFHAASRDVQREVRAEPPVDQSAASWEAQDIEPTPAEAAMVTDLVAHLLSRLEGRHREILTLSLQRYSPTEISAKIGCTERTVYRVLERVKEWLKRAHDEE